MSFKPEFPEHAPILLSGHEVLAVHGADAAAFLQAQTMNDVAALAPGRWHWNGWLTAKGRVVALFALLRTAPDRFVMILPDVPAATLQPALQRFVFRSKVTIAAAGLRAAVGAPDPRVAGAAIAGDEASGLAIDVGGDGGPRTLFLVPGDVAATEARPAADAAWRAFDLAHGLPRLGEAQSGAWTPQMLSLDRLQAYSLKKGCYPGQEIVARTHYLGQARRSLARLSGDALAEGDPIDADGTAVGTVVCTTAGGDEALAVLAADADPARLRTNGRPVVVIPLNGGLARVT